MMDWLGRLRGDPEDRPLDKRLVVPDEEIEADAYEPEDDMGDADSRAAAEAGEGAEPDG
jgi:hypothetical protein